MIITTPILKSGDGFPKEELMKLDGKESKVPLFDKPGDGRKVIGKCTKTFYKDEMLWAEIELFDFNISTGFNKLNFNINELLFFRVPGMKPPKSYNMNW